MKQIIISATFILCCSFIVLKEKTFFAFNIYQAGQDGGPKAPLEKTIATFATVKGNKTSVSTVYEFNGGKSPVRINSVDAIFRTTSDNMTAKTDPATVIQLYKIVSSKNKRSFSLIPDTKVLSSSVAISFQQDEFLNFKILLSSYLTPGEYAFLDKSTAKSDGSITVFCFGID